MAIGNVKFRVNTLNENLINVGSSKGLLDRMLRTEAENNSLNCFEEVRLKESTD
jgi:hypothetical protein